MSKESFEGSRTFPVNRNKYGPRNRSNYGPAERRSDVPKIKSVATPALSKFVPGNRLNGEPIGLAERKPFLLRNHTGNTSQGELVTPLFKQSLTREFKRSGGRVGGGGASKDAIRRARWKYKIEKFK